MPKDADQLIFRIAPDVIRRLDRLARALADTPEVRALGPRRGATRSYAARIALLEGLDAAEQRYGITKARR